MANDFPLDVPDLGGSAATLSLIDLDAAVDKMAEIKGQIEDLEEQIKRLNAAKGTLERKVLAAMEATDRRNYATARAQVVKVTRFMVSMPKDPEPRAALFGWLKEQGAFESIVSINHNTLNSFYKEQMEAAKERGDIDFAVPGLGEPKSFEYVTIKRKG